MRPSLPCRQAVWSEPWAGRCMCQGPLRPSVEASEPLARRCAARWRQGRGPRRGPGASAREPGPPPRVERTRPAAIRDRLWAPQAACRSPARVERLQRARPRAPTAPRRCRRSPQRRRRGCPLGRPLRPAARPAARGSTGPGQSPAHARHYPTVSSSSSCHSNRAALAGPRAGCTVRGAPGRPCGACSPVRRAAGAPAACRMEHSLFGRLQQRATPRWFLFPVTGCAPVTQASPGRVRVCCW